jgi:hypothetical protein
LTRNVGIEREALERPLDARAALIGGKIAGSKIHRDAMSGCDLGRCSSKTCLVARDQQQRMTIASEFVGQGATDALRRPGDDDAGPGLLGGLVQLGHVHPGSGNWGGKGQQGRSTARRKARLQVRRESIARLKGLGNRPSSKVE